MKVEHSRTSHGAAIGPTGSDLPRPARKTGGAAGPDRVQLSGDLRLANEAVKAAGTSLEPRPDLVAAARADLAAGTLGADLDRLADRIVDALTYPHDDHIS